MLILIRETKSKAKRSQARRDFSTPSTFRTSTFPSMPAGSFCFSCKHIVFASLHCSRSPPRKDSDGNDGKRKKSNKEETEGGGGEKQASRQEGRRVALEAEREKSRREGGKGGREGSSRKKSSLARRARRQDSSRWDSQASSSNRSQSLKCFHLDQFQSWLAESRNKADWKLTTGDHHCSCSDGDHYDDDDDDDDDDDEYSNDDDNGDDVCLREGEARGCDASLLPNASLLLPLPGCRQWINSNK